MLNIEFRSTSLFIIRNSVFKIKNLLPFAFYLKTTKARATATGTIFQAAV